LAAEFLTPVAEIPRAPPFLRRWHSLSACNFRRAARDQHWRVSCHSSLERFVVRATVLSIVLSIAAGPNVALLCAVWCHVEQADSSEWPSALGPIGSAICHEGCGRDRSADSRCHRDDFALSIQQNGESCCQEPGVYSTFTKEEQRRGAERHSIVLPSEFVGDLSAAPPGQHYPRISPVDQPPDGRLDIIAFRV
jgi:hypothetical protein